MLASLRSRRLAALLVALSLGLCAVAPRAMACDMDEGAPPAPARAAMGMDGEACPMHPAAPAQAPSRAPAAPSGPALDCCAAGTAPAPLTERTVRAPAQPVIALVALVATVPAVLAPRRVPEAVARPPAPPGHLHLLYGCFLT